MSTGFQHLGYTTEERNRRAFHNTEANLRIWTGPASDGFLESGVIRELFKKVNSCFVKRVSLGQTGGPLKQRTPSVKHYPAFSVAALILCLILWDVPVVMHSDLG